MNLSSKITIFKKILCLLYVISILKCWWYVSISAVPWDDRSILKDRASIPILPLVCKGLDLYTWLYSQSKNHECQTGAKNVHTCPVFGKEES